MNVLVLNCVKNVLVDSFEDLTCWRSKTIDALTCWRSKTIYSAYYLYYFFGVIFYIISKILIKYSCVLLSRKSSLHRPIFYKKTYKSYLNHCLLSGVCHIYCVFFYLLTPSENVIYRVDFKKYYKVQPTYLQFAI